MRFLRKGEAKVSKEISTDEVTNGKTYRVVTVSGRTGLVVADVKEEWVETHPRVVYFLPPIDDHILVPGDKITKILDEGYD